MVEPPSFITLPMTLTVVCVVSVIADVITFAKVSWVTEK